MKRIPALAVMAAGLAAVLVSTAMRHDDPTTGEAPFAGVTETAVFAGGCFWGLQAAFDEVPGVVSTRVGYTGGTTSDPTYGQVVAGKSGHAEAVEVKFDPDRVSFEELVRHFFAHHRPWSDEAEATYCKRAYRSAIFVNNERQRECARRLVAEMVEQNVRGQPVATLIADATTFWGAEAEHQKYLARCAH